ncbi:MAG: SusC/RagA family TonB-linked outer membrane protein [Bacteroidales bacterium]|nr:SusC/RagA family TonB-linked outer membrane protein [Bacteroidales bacterium]MDY6002044.1 SusC/RagA family TonB-linked outer membrane protein [Candidatus Cryptobacteroides sp.]
MEVTFNFVRKLRKECIALILIFSAPSMFAQNITVSGTVTDASGETVIGAGVVIVNTGNGVITNNNGEYTIKCAAKDTLQFSYIGYNAKVVPVNGRSIINITFDETSTALNEAVVTALGMKRETKALGYAVTTVKSDEIERANTISPVAALQGKAAGIEINQSDGGMFGSTKIQIRGASTLHANNQPIFVVDGVILDNATSNTGDADWDGEIHDYGNQLKNLNPDDFESVSVLKGAAATALYGSRGLNGAVVITTKSGKSGKGLGIHFSQTVGIDYVYKAPDLQNEYLEGAFPGYVYYGDDYDQTGNRWSNNMTAYSRNSDKKYSMISQHEGDGGGVGWGPHISWAEGKTFEQYDGTMGPMKIYKNNYRDAYRTGWNSDTNVSLQGGTDRTTFYASASYKYNQGTTPRNTFYRYSFLGKASQKIGSRVKLDFSISYVQSQPRNAQRNIGSYFAEGTFPREYDVNKYKHLYKGTHGGIASGTYGDAYRSVPGRGLWWSIYEDNYSQTETTIRPTVNLTVDATDWLQFSVGGNLNRYLIDSEGKYPGSGYANEGGSYSIGHSQILQENGYASMNVNKRFNDDWEAHGFLREEYFNQHAQYNGEWTNGGLVVPNQYFIGNSKNQAGFGGYKYNTKRIVSTIFQVGTSWRDQVFLDVTGRNDWSSALIYTNGRGNYSYFYPSVSGSWIINQTFREQLPIWISFAKIRASWAQVGNDTDPYYINSGYSLTTLEKNGSKVYGLGLSSQIKSPDLKPEKKTSWEVGLDWRFLNNKIGIDFTYYKENTRNQIMSVSVPWWSGVSSELINAGNIQNKGVELELKTTPVQSRDFQWDLNFTYTRNRNKIISLHEDVANWITLDGSTNYGNYRIGSVAKVGADYGLLMSDSMPKIDEKTGKQIVGYSNEAHTPYLKRAGKVQEIGSMIPKFLGSMNTTFRYKNLSLYLSFDARFGGYVASYGSRYATAYGYSGATEKYRLGETWTSNFADCAGITYSDGFIPDVIFDEGTKVTVPGGETVDVGGMTYQEAYDKGYVEYAHLQTWAYFKNNWGNGVVNNDWFKKLNYISLREITLAYALPERIYSHLGAKGLSVSLTGRNVCYLLNTAPNHENPESVRGTGAAQFRMRSYSPYTASWLFTISASF